MDILFQIHYEWNKELFFLYYQTQNRKYRRILLFFCGAVIIFSFCLCNKIEREMIMTMMILFVCAVILVNNIYLRLATYIQMETVLKQYGTGKRIMTIKKDEINVLVPESGRKIIVSFIEIMEIGTIKEYCWIRVINQLIFIRKENFVIGDIEDFKRFIKFLLAFGSSAEVGSSIISIDGFIDIAVAIAAKFFCPPDNLYGALFFNSNIPTFFSDSVTLLSTSSLLNL